jgi:competence protein ComEC
MSCRQSSIAVHGAALLAASAAATLLPMSQGALFALLIMAALVAVRRPCVAPLASAALGAWLATACIDAYLAARWPAELDGARVLVEARIESLPGARGGEWVADVSAVTRAPATLAGRDLRLRLSGALGPAQPQVGERWQFVVAAASPRARVNPGGVDLERQWLLERVHGRARVLDSPLNARLARAAPGLQPLRAALRERVLETVSERDAAALLIALAIGDTAAMSREQWRVFAATGITHLVAISGLHVTLFAWLVAACVRWAWPRLWLPAPLRRQRRETVALALGFVAAAAYSLLAGFSIPTQRTVAMLAIVLLARLAGRVTSRWDVLGGAAIAVVLIDPLATLDMGFWLSFGALAALMLPAPLPTPLPRSMSGPATTATVLLRGCRALLREQAWIGLALMPLTLFLFDAVSIAGFVVNLVAIPVFSFVLVPLALLGTLLPPIAAPLPSLALEAAAWLHAGLWLGLRTVADFPGATLATAVPWPWWALAAAMLLGWLLPAPARLRGAALLVVLPLIASASIAPAAGRATLTVLDVGDAGAVLLRTRSHSLLLGTGGGRDRTGHAVDRHLLPWLRRQRIQRLDALIVARASSFEAPGVARLLDALPVREVWVGADWPAAPAPVRICPPRTVRRLDGVQVEWFSAGLEAGPQARVPGACAVRITAGDRSALWIGAATGADLAVWSRAPAQVRADVLIGGLRARRDAGAWAKAVRPATLVSTVGRDAAAQRALAQAYRLSAVDVHLPAVSGPLTLELAPRQTPRAAAVLDRWLAPRWRVPRRTTAVL